MTNVRRNQLNAGMNLQFVGYIGEAYSPTLLQNNL
jgi:hypothetical protein